MVAKFGEQEHGYRSGHELLHATIKLGRDDQDTVDRLSDIAGPTRPGEQFAPYLTTYPLPSRSFYVLARTWQDLAAPRAGCVVTKSVFIPMAKWVQSNDIPELFGLLDQATFESIPQVFASAPVSLRAVHDPRKTELVEALFLETRQPIVYFDAKNAENIILRLLLALWPNLRRNFATCSFSLAPRRISGREFDLLFAPASARSRFADWPGRKITSAVASSPRHRWSSAMASQIFDASVPSLQANDELGLLTNDPNADESSLRLSLLWNELSAKASHTPSAVLGMLDIVNSQDKNAGDFTGHLVPVVSSAIIQIASAESTSEAWQFMGTLFGKFPGRTLPTQVVGDIESATQLLTRRDAITATQFLSSELRSHHMPPAAMYRGIAKGLTETKLSRELFDSILSVPREGILNLMMVSDICATMLVGLAKEYIQLPALANLLTGIDRETAKSLRKNVIPLIYDPEHAVLLPAILTGIPDKDLADTAVRIFAQAGFQGAPLRDAIIGAARSAEALSAVRSAVAGHFDGTDADQFLVGTLQLDRGSVEWLSSGGIDVQRARRLLMALLEKTPDRALLAGQRDGHVLNGIVRLLAGDIANSAQQMARLLDIGQFDTKQLLEMCVPLLPYLNGKANRRLILELTEAAFTSAPVDDVRVAQIAETAAFQLGIEPLLEFVAMRKATDKRVGENVRVMDQLPDACRQRVLQQVDVVSEKLIYRGLHGCGAPVYDAWARMLVDAEGEQQPAFARAAAPTLAYAMRQTSEPVSSLIVATFPIVYAELLKSSDDGGPSLPMIMLMPIAIFMDWDKAKSARKDLISAFMNSSWPPSDLLKAANRAGIATKVLQRVRRSHGGDQYLHLLEQDIRKKSDRDGGADLRELWNSVSHAGDEDWD